MSDLDVLTSQPHAQLNIKLWQEYINCAVMYTSFYDSHWGYLVDRFVVICALKDKEYVSQTQWHTHIYAVCPLKFLEISLTPVEQEGNVNMLKLKKFICGEVMCRKRPITICREKDAKKGRVQRKNRKEEREQGERE